MSVALDEVADDIRGGCGGAGAVAPVVLGGQVNRCPGEGCAGRAWPDPGEGQPGVALEEPMRPYATGRASLGRVLPEGGDLDGRAGGGDDHRFAVPRIVG